MYEWVLFDADNTLFHFDSFIGLQTMFTKLGVMFNETDFDAYEMLNSALWRDYGNGTITAEHLQTSRFQMWGSKLNTSPIVLNERFLLEMLKTSTLIDGALNVLHFLAGKIKVGLVTNGFSWFQYERLKLNQCRDLFDIVITSEDAGIAKPHPCFFDYVFSVIENPSREKVLIVGDNIESDILGGINFGIDVCWFNSSKKISSAPIKPHYEIHSLLELKNFL